MAVTLRVVGCGDAFGTAGRLQACFLLEHGGLRALVDCGATSLAGLRRLAIDPTTIACVLISHLHGDHFGGLPFFVIDALYSSHRVAPLVVAGPPGTEARILAVLDLLYPGSRERYARTPVLDVVELVPKARRAVCGLHVTPYPVVHSSGAPAYAFRIEIGGRHVAYSGDTAWTDDLIDVSRDADLFICECSTFDKPVPMHVSYADLKLHANALAMRRLILTHAGPDLMAHRREVGDELAEDGQVITL